MKILNASFSFSPNRDRVAESASSMARAFIQKVGAKRSFEFGTYKRVSTTQLALNLPDDGMVYMLNIREDHPAYTLAIPKAEERQFAAETGKEGFGLSSLAMQVMGYLMLLEFWVTGAISRFLANHKEDPSSSGNMALMSEGIYLFGAQGVLLMIEGAVFSLLQSLSHIRRPAFGAILCLGLAMACLGEAPIRNAPALIRLLITPALMGAVVWVAWKTILTPELRSELLSRMDSGCAIATYCHSRKVVL